MDRNLPRLHPRSPGPARPLSRRGPLTLLLWLGAVAACAPAEDPPSAGNTSSPAPAAPAVTAPLTPLETPRSWQGVLPCADCDGIRTTLTLEPDGVWYRTAAYLGKAPEPDTLFGGIGTWELSEGRSRIELKGGGDGAEYLSVLEGGDLRVLDRSGNPIHSELEDRLRPLPDPPLPAGRLHLVGAFTYLADAALLVICDGGIQLPVAMEAGYLPLERAYTAAQVPAGSPLVVRIQGTLGSRPAMEGDGSERVIVVESHDVLDRDMGCAALRLPDLLSAGEWILQELDGAPLPHTPGEVPTLSWDPAASQVAGSSGCNRYTGRGFLRGSRLVVEALAGTRRFCEGAMELEARVLEVLQGGGRLAADGGGLVLFQGPDPVARFTRAGEDAPG